MTRVRPLLRALPVLALAWVLLALPSNASADCSDTPSGPGCATVTIAPPPMGGTLQGTPPRFVYGQVTADPQPTFGVQVSGWQPGDTLQCGIGTEADLGTCGPPLPGCAAEVCDVLGRPDPSPAAVDFNPIPCQIRARRVSIGQLVRTGLPVSLDCHFADAVSVFVNSAPCGVYSCVGVRHFTGSTSRIWKVRARFRVQRRYVRALKAGRQVRIDVVVEPNAYGEPSVEKLTLH